MEEADCGKLLQYLSAYAGAQCSGPRDVIFSLLSISSDRADFQVDYTKSKVNVYSSVALHYIKSG